MTSPTPSFRADAIDRPVDPIVVTAQEMGEIEARLFAAGMPVAALMEKVAGRIARWVQVTYPRTIAPRVGVLVGPGHNGGDGLVVARELHFAGYEVMLYLPFTRLKPLTESHARYARSLGIPQVDNLEPLQRCHVLIDGLFGFGLTRPLEGEIAAVIDRMNESKIPVVSIDLPSGLHTDTGEVLGTAVRATTTLCLGLWKRAFLLDRALEWVGRAERIDFDLPLDDIQAVLGEQPTVTRITSQTAIAALPLPRSPTAHKYRQGHLLLVCGSRSYMGAAILAGLAARASGVGMLSIAVPASLTTLLIAQLPDALVLGCPETEEGAIAHLPNALPLDRYHAIACGPGLTTAATTAVQHLLDAPVPLILDADGLNILVNHNLLDSLGHRAAETILTPHPGEFKRLFPDLFNSCADPIAATQAAARRSGAIVLHKGARVIIASPHGRTTINPTSTPALARGGSGDVLTGLMGGLLAQWRATQPTQPSIHGVIDSAVWWHAHAAQYGEQRRTQLGVDASSLTQFLHPALLEQMAERVITPKLGYTP